MPQDVPAAHTGEHSIRGSKLLLTLASHWCALWADKYCRQNWESQAVDSLRFKRLYVRTSTLDMILVLLHGNRETPKSGLEAVICQHSTPHLHEIRDSIMLRVQTIFSSTRCPVSTATLLLVLSLHCSIKHPAPQGCAQQYPQKPHVDLQHRISLVLLVLNTKFCK